MNEEAARTGGPPTTGLENVAAGAEAVALTAVQRVQLELHRMEDRQHAYLRIRAFLRTLPESPERERAWRLAKDRLGLTPRRVA